MAKPKSTCACPRCGYDLSGAVDSWKRLYQVGGVCSECGLEISWQDVLDGEFARVPKFFESQHRWRLRDLFQTGVKCMLPWRFWRWINMSQSIAAQRAAFATCVGAGAWALILAPLIAALMTGAIVLVTQYSAQVQATYTPTFLEHAHDLLLGWSDATAMLLIPALLLTPMVLAAMILTTVLTLMILNDSFKAARVRKVHLVRLAIYPFAGVPLICLSLIVWWLVAWSVSAMNMSWWYSLQRPLNVAPEYIRTEWIEYAFFTMGTCVLALWFTLSVKHFLGDYLRLPHAWRDSVVLCILSFLFGAPVSVLALAVIVHALR